MNYDELTLMEDSIFLNSKVIHEDDFGASLAWLSDKFAHHESCPFCSTKMEHMLQLDYEDSDFEYDEKFSSLKICSYCNYWQWYLQDPYAQNSWGCPDHYVHAGVSKVRDFEIQLPDGCYDELAENIRRNPKLWHTINPTEFEKFVAAVFKANYQDSEVIHVGRPDDGGTDVIFIDSGHRQWLIQVKRRESPSSTEGVGTLRSLLGTMTLEDSSYGIVVSTADHFSYRAKEAVGQANKVGKSLKLIDRGKLDRMIGKMLKDKPWKYFLQANYDQELISKVDAKWQNLRQ